MTALARLLTEASGGLLLVCTLGQEHPMQHMHQGLEHLPASMPTLPADEVLPLFGLHIKKAYGRTGAAATWNINMARVPTAPHNFFHLLGSQVCLPRSESLQDNWHNYQDPRQVRGASAPVGRGAGGPSCGHQAA